MNQKKISSILKPLFIAIVIFSFIMPLDLSAKKQKAGAYLLIFMENGQFIEGELLCVKDSSLLLMTGGTNTEATIDISEVQEMRIKRKRNFWTGFLKGGWIGLSGGTVAGLCFCSHEPEGLRYKGCVIASGIIFGIYAGLAGGIFNVTARKYKRTPIFGKSPDEIENFLKQLREKSRFKD